MTLPTLVISKRSRSGLVVGTGCSMDSGTIKSIPRILPGMLKESFRPRTRLLSHLHCMEVCEAKVPPVPGHLSFTDIATGPLAKL